MKHTRRVVFVILGALLLLCLVASVATALINRALLAQYHITGAAAVQPERLTELDKSRLAETLRLKEKLGDQVWPGLGRAEIPVILWTSGVEFLVGVPEPPTAAGGERWRTVEGDTFAGRRYFRRLNDDPQNFAVRIGEGWAASLATKEESDRFLIEMFRSQLPGPVKTVFPYRALILPSEVQMTGVLHEAFHVYQATMAAERLQAAERAHRLEQRYASAGAAMQDAWAEEANLLVKALQAKTETDARALARQFLDRRSQRREAAGLQADLIDYERQLEWEEGVAKYVELAIWKAASDAAGYQPLPEMAADPTFKGYRTFGQRFGQELATLRSSATQDGETRFYYTGMAQAMLLDRLAPGWQTHALDDGVWLEDLLKAGV